MSQYTVGSVDVTNGSANIVGHGTSWLANVTIGSLFSALSSGVPYVVGNVVDDTHITLASPYAGTTASTISYALTTSYTPNLGLPYPEQGDVDTATVLKRAMILIDQDVAVANVTINGTSATPMTPANGSVTFTTQTGKQFAYPQYIIVGSRGTPSAYMSGQVTAYDPATGIITANMNAFGGTGAHTDWDLSLSGIVGKGINWTGAWNSSFAYILGDAVAYNGSSYLAILSGTNHAPPNATYWSILDLGLYNRGTWNSGTGYNPNDVVQYNGSSYMSIQAGTNHTPPAPASAPDAYWTLLAAKGDIGLTGSAATIAVGTVTTGAAGSSAIINNSGTSGAAVFDFTIPRGDAGSVWRDGTGVPSNALGLNGDYYLDDATGNVYLRTSGTYSIVANIKGPTGTAGTVWRDGSGVPSNALGVNGDYYLNDATGDVYLKTAGAYSIVANIKGPIGVAATIAVGTVSTGAPGSSATVTNVGTSGVAVFDFSIPAGHDGAGAVSSVALTAPAEFTVSGSPITSTGTLALTKANQNANLVWAGPTSGSPAAPGFRALVAADLPGTIGTNFDYLLNYYTNQ